MSDIEIAVEFISDSDKAYHLHDGEKDFWIPKSAVNDYCETRGKISSIFISEWWAEKKGLI